jgi:micrococcal nuclease
MKNVSIVAFIAASLIASQAVYAQPARDLPAGDDAVVTRVIDGDTIEVRVNDTRFTVRYIGIDAPETKGTPAQTCLSRQATAANKALVQGKTLRLERDVSEFDKYGRLLRYAYLPDGKMVNESLVLNGFALSATYPPDVKYVDLLAEAQQTAREQKIGLWSKCPQLVAASAKAFVPEQSPVIAATNVPQPEAPAAASNCDPSYPTICIPPGSPDLDCPDIPYRRFEVKPPDPHRFDGDHDGIGCEK